MNMPATAPLPRWHRRVRDQVYDHVFGHPEGEVGGVLVGRTDDDGHTIITAAIAALRADGQRASLTFTHDAWSEVHEVMDRKYPDQKIVGWYHSHPGFGIFLSDHDLFIHRNFFGDVHQVAFVVDPLAGMQGTFGWSRGEVVKFREGPTRRPALVSAPASDHRPRRPVFSRLRVVLVLVALGALIGVGVGLVAFAPSGQVDPATLPRTTVPPINPTVSRKSSGTGKPIGGAHTPGTPAGGVTGRPSSELQTEPGGTK
jgi:proteasome lid subunit RPN8/RPN11